VDSLRVLTPYGRIFLNSDPEHSRQHDIFGDRMDIHPVKTSTNCVKWFRLL